MTFGRFLPSRHFYLFGFDEWATLDDDAALILWLSLQMCPLPDRQETVTRVRDLKRDRRPAAPTRHPVGTPLTRLLVWTAPPAAGGSDLPSALGKRWRPPEGCPYGRSRDQCIRTQLQASRGLPQLQEARIAGAHLRRGLLV